MYRVIITNASGETIKKTSLSGPEQSIAAWEQWWDEYRGKKAIMRLLARSTIKLSHRFDLEHGFVGYAGKHAAAEFFGTALPPVGRPYEGPKTKITLSVPADMAEKIDAEACRRGMKRSEHMISVLSQAHADDIQP